ncbi:exonuclease SbcCD subunit D C-terminal domain-containing protein [Desulfopila aestuarii]|uniref:Nuclease SbcCD subunit D n=1 Tax=Desulfopila aestuarii DSM 18488 TaxID=1121416 RepID=A0A1M7YEK1_9BACT|nr:exonuclease SbcCD subunit D C-terminal domain-containing protein [Desulfopila aestuarii]SHO51067.1 Exodeoxyribonuclease I subunit D [Desulfopila aestuarii DSM 18488]
MNILHTSDWHIGRTLYGRKRYDEFAAFLDWLVHTIEEHHIDVLIVAGDIFDTSTPSNRAQQLYYRFLQEVSAGCCRHVIIIGGNHDSPSLLEAPKELLRYFQIHVVGRAADNIEYEVLVLKDEKGNDELIVCAIPYLRDREIRNARAGEDIDDKNRNLIEGIATHYQKVVAFANGLRQASDHFLPIIATGHLFMVGGKKVEGDGVRDLYVGSLAHVDGTILPPEIDYLALGHLHSAQMVAQDPTRRYSGSPLPMSFGEAEKVKQVLLVTLTENDVAVTPITVPNFQRLETVRGNIEEIVKKIETLKKEQQPVWLEVIYDGTELVSQLQLTLRETVADSPLEILRIVNNRLIARILESTVPQETLDTLSEEAVFHRCLEAHNIPEGQHEELLHLFGETLQAITDEDKQAE